MIGAVRATLFQHRLLPSNGSQTVVRVPLGVAKAFEEVRETPTFCSFSQKKIHSCIFHLWSSLNTFLNFFGIS